MGVKPIPATAASNKRVDPRIIFTSQLLDRTVPNLFPKIGYMDSCNLPSVFGRPGLSPEPSMHRLIARRSHRATKLVTVSQRFRKTNLGPARESSFSCRFPGINFLHV